MLERDKGYTKDELAKALGLSKRTIETHWMQYGVKYGGTWLFSGAVILDDLDRRFRDREEN